jgi:hypothetical protein
MVRLGTGIERVPIGRGRRMFVTFGSRFIAQPESLNIARPTGVPLRSLSEQRSRAELL